MHVTDVTCDDRKARVTTITMCALRPQWECYLTKQTQGVRAKVTVGNCANGKSRKVQAWCTRHLAAGVIHSFPTPPARRRTTHTADHTQAPAVWRQFIYDWRLLKLSATVLDDWSCLMQPRCVVHTHTHIMAASSIFSCLSVARSAET